MTDREAEMARALQKIAEGKHDGRPFAGETARLMARECLSRLGIDWQKPPKGWGNE